MYIQIAREIILRNFHREQRVTPATNQIKWLGTAANLKYIATRPGADRGDLEPETSEAYRDPRERSIEDDFGPVKPGTAAGHVKYMSERPGSHGLFDADGVANLKAAMHEIKHHKGIVWRDVVSLHEDDAVRLGYTTREAWEDALRRAMPDVAMAMGIREDNLRWVAAFHQKTMQALVMVLDSALMPA